MSNKIGWIVAGAILVILLVAGSVTAVVVSGGDPESVSEVADAAVEAAEDLDIDAGADLLCRAPSSEDRSELAELIEEAQDESGTDDPDVDYDVSKIEGDTEGSFEVRIASDEDGLEGRELAVRVLVEHRDDRSCISDAEAVD